MYGNKWRKLSTSELPQEVINVIRHRYGNRIDLKYVDVSIDTGGWMTLKGEFNFACYEYLPVKLDFRSPYSSCLSTHYVYAIRDFVDSKEVIHS